MEPFFAVVMGLDDLVNGLGIIKIAEHNIRCINTKLAYFSVS